MRDRHFWSGSLIIAVSLIAGASALPSLLLRPEPIDPSFVSAPRVAAAPLPVNAGPRVAPPVEAPETVSEASPAPSALSAGPLPQPAAAQAVGSGPEQPAGAATAQAAAAVSVPPAPAAQAERPPQDEKPAQLVEKRVPAAEKPVRTAERAPRKTTHLHPVRPALFPIREFLALQR